MIWNSISQIYNILLYEYTTNNLKKMKNRSINWYNLNLFLNYLKVKSIIMLDSFSEKKILPCNSSLGIKYFKIRNANIEKNDIDKTKLDCNRYEIHYHEPLIFVLSLTPYIPVLRGYMYYFLPSNYVRGNLQPPQQMPSLYVRKLYVTCTLLIIN